MLGFSSLFDAHFHLISQNLQNFPVNFIGFTCAHSIAEWNEQEQRIDFLCKDSSLNRVFYRGFGIHPWKPFLENADFLEKLLQDKKIDGIGEAGFDFYTPALKETKLLQKQCWDIQVTLALQYKKPLIIHLRKGMEEIYADMERLKCLSGILFHGFSGNSTEALALLKKLPFAQFSFGEPLLKNGRKAFECLKALPESNILLETDESGIEKLPLIYEKARELKGNFICDVKINGLN